MRYLSFLLLFTFLSTFGQETHSVARKWNEVLLQAIRNDLARPTVHARNLFHHSMAMYDAWAIYDTEARTCFLGNSHNGFMVPSISFPFNDDIQSRRNETISYASYRLLNHRFKGSPGADESLALIDSLMNALGYDPGNTETDYTYGNPAAIGNYIAQQLILFGHQDGSNEQNDYANLYYESVNEPLVPRESGIGDQGIEDPNRWQPLRFEQFVDQSGNVIEGGQPDFLSPEWGNVYPFSLEAANMTTYQRDGHTYNVYHDPGPPVFINTMENDEASQFYKWNFELVSIWSAHLDPENETLWDISPASLGNIDPGLFPGTEEEYKNFYNTDNGGDIGIGYEVNPVTNHPYEPQMVKRGDYARILAEFWADGPDSETPPGHWFTILNYVNDHPLFEKRLQGQGEVLDDLEWDVKSYFMLGGAMHDAAIAAWSVKGYYDYIRPISAIRYLADRGQCSDNTLDNFHEAGINLIPGLIEVVEEGDPLQGFSGEHIGKIKLWTWRGHNAIPDPEFTYAGVGWIRAEDWNPYQRQTFVTPPFAGYVSGHSTYSRAAAELMTLLTGDPYFPGGVGEFEAPKDEFLVFENGPSEDVVLQWATYRDASDQCSLSRIWGGIHPPIDDIPGRIIGIKVGPRAFEHALSFFSGKVVLRVSDAGEIDDVLIYPNPVKSKARLALDSNREHEMINLFDINGRLVKRLAATRINTGLFELNLSFLETGAYMLTQPENDVAIKILKE